MKQAKRAAVPADGAEINGRIAGRVRSLRLQSAMSLDALAARSRVSRSMLSLVERGESSPTAVVLEKIAAGLGVPLVSLFDDDAGPTSPVSRGVQRQPWRDPGSGYVRRNLSPPGYPSPIQMAEVVLPPGARVAYETGAREVAIHQQIWMLEGRMEVTVGEVTYALAGDDCLAMQLDEPTAFRNRTRKPARYVVVVVTDPARPARR